MRKYTTPSVVSAVVLALFTACSSNDENSGAPGTPAGPGPGPAAGTGSITAVIDGQSWSAGPGPAGCRLGALSQGGAIGICGTDGVYQIPLSVRAAIGTYQLGVAASGGESASLIQLANQAIWAPSRLQGSGEIVVSSLTATTISGTFTFTGGPLVPPATGIRTVTNGQFNLPVCSGASC
jgi:hypothetical protein